jgi:hypothetical protein
LWTSRLNTTDGNVAEPIGSVIEALKNSVNFFDGSASRRFLRLLQKLRISSCCFDICSLIACSELLPTICLIHELQNQKCCTCNKPSPYETAGAISAIIAGINTRGGLQCVRSSFETFGRSYYQVSINYRFRG